MDYKPVHGFTGVQSYPISSEPIPPYECGYRDGLGGYGDPDNPGGWWEGVDEEEYQMGYKDGMGDRESAFGCAGCAGGCAVCTMTDQLTEAWQYWSLGESKPLTTDQLLGIWQDL